MKTLIAAVLLIAAGTSFAQTSPAGLWKTIDDDTKQPKSTVRITESGGVLTGKVETILDPARQDAKCDACTDERKDQPVLGMTIIRNVMQSTDDKNVWGGGDILDPNNGKVYKVRMTPVDGGKALEVRGFIGFALLGRTQTWTRVE